MRILLKKLTNKFEFREFMEALYNNAAECSPNISELGLAGFVADICVPEAIGMEQSVKIAKAADALDG